MKTARLFMTLVAVIATPALANNPPAPQMALAEITILPLMMILTAVGGGYAVLRKRRRAGRVMRVLGMIAIVLLILVSLVHEGFALPVLTLFAIVTIIRAVRMIIWSARPPGIEGVAVSPPRLAVAGTTLLVLAILFGGAAFAFFGYWESSDYTNSLRVEALRKFVALRMPDAQRYPGIAEYREDYEVRLNNILAGGTKGTRLLVETSPDGRFFAYVLPRRRLPFFPYKYLASAPSYYASETGEIRMARVHDWNERCPPDAPVVDRVTPRDFEELEKGQLFSEK